MDEPKITVCIPTFNRVGLLRASLQSVMWQSYRNVEIIVSDNASDDGTTEYLASLDDPRVIHDRLPENIGLFRNMSRCLTLGTGKYRVVLPDDDLMLPGNLERKVRFLEENPSAGLVHSAFRYLDDDALPTGPTSNWSRLGETTLEPGPSFLNRSINLGGIVCVSSVMLRSDLVADEIFNADDGPYADLALWLRVANRSDVGFIAEPLSGFLVHQGSASSGFQTVRVRRGHHQMTEHHADAILQAHGRFVENADLPWERRAELKDALTRCDRRLRWSVRANTYIPPKLLELLKRAAGWRHRGRLHRLLALDAAYGPPPLADRSTALQEA